MMGGVGAQSNKLEKDKLRLEFQLLRVSHSHSWRGITFDNNINTATTSD